MLFLKEVSIVLLKRVKKVEGNSFRLTTFKLGTSHLLRWAVVDIFEIFHKSYLHLERIPHGLNQM